MSNSPRKLVASSIEITDPIPITRNKTITFSNNNRFYGEQSSVTQTYKQCGIESKTYHSQVVVKAATTVISDGTGTIFPILEFTPTSGSETIDIGKITIKIIHKYRDSNDNSGALPLFSLVSSVTGTNTDDSNTTTYTASLTTETALLSNLGTTNTLVGFTIDGENSSSADVKKSYIFEPNIRMQAEGTLSSPPKLLRLGLQFVTAPAQTSIFLVETHTEVISTDFGTLESHTAT